MILVGWTIRYCAVGVAAPTGGLLGKVGTRFSDSSEDAEIAIALEANPSNSIPVPDIARFVRAGKTRLGVFLRSHDPGLPPDLPYAWLTVTATRRMTIDADLEAAFFKDTRLGAQRLSDRYSSEIRNQLRPVAQLATSLTGVWLSNAVLLPWVEQERYFHSQADSEGFSEGTRGESLEVRAVEKPELLSHVLDIVSCARLPAKERRIITLAAQQFTEARAELVGSSSRLIGMVTCLQTLSALAPVTSATEFRERRDALRQLVTEKSPELLLFVDRLLDRPPTAATRLAGLGRLLRRADVDADVTAFRAMWKLRNDIVHGARDLELQSPAETALSVAADHMAKDYLTACVAYQRAEAVRQSKLILV